MAITLADVKLYLRIDANYEDTFLTQCMSAADSYLVGAVDNYSARYEADNGFVAEADLLKLALVSEFYRNRDTTNDSRDRFPYYIRSALLHLQTWGDADD